MWRKAAAVALVTAPIALTVSTGVDPALGDDQGYGVYRAHPDATQWHSLLLHWAWVLFVPGMLGLLTPIRTRGAVLARIAWVSVVLGLSTFAALMAMDFRRPPRSTRASRGRRSPGPAGGGPGCWAGRCRSCASRSPRRAAG
jgi:hypothetical protein